MSKKKLSDEEKLEVIREKISEIDFPDQKLNKLIKNISPYSDFNNYIDKYYDIKLTTLLPNQIIELYKNIVMGCKNRKILIKNIKCDNEDLDFYVDLIKDFKLSELRLFHIDLTYNVKYMTDDIEDKKKFYNIKQDHYIKTDLTKLSLDELKIVYYCINHMIIHQDLVLNEKVDKK